MHNYKKIELGALYLVHRLAFIDSNDLRFIENDRSKRIIENSWVMRCGFNKSIVNHFIKKLKHIGLIQLENKFKENRNIISETLGYYYFGKDITCCDSCHTGVGDTKIEDIILQREKYGMYVCKKCEKIAEEIDNVSFSLLSKNGFYKNEGLKNPNNRWLGFGGSRIVIKHNSGKITLTNSLFVERSLHICFYEKIKHKINCELFWVKDFRKESLHFLSEEEMKSIQPQIQKAKELGHIVE